MSSLTGTWRLVRLALRRDRIKLPLWIAIVIGMLAANVPAVKDFYASSLEDRVSYAVTTAASLVGRIFNGPLAGPEFGEIVANETLIPIVILVAFMSTLAIVRHTRQNEETGRLELIGSAVVGRYASLAAALIVTIGTNILLGILVTATLAAQDLSLSGSIGYGAAVCAIGITFAAIAAITSQVSETSRGANSMAAIAIGVLFLVRGIGDSLGHLTADKMGVVSSWLSWLSPLGWIQQIHFFTDQSWWIFGLFAVLITALLFIAVALNARRDVGSGLIASRNGPAHAAASLLSPFGLAWRLQKGTLKGWAAIVAVMGVTIGIIVKEFSTLFTENEDLAKFVETLGGKGSFEDVFFGGMILYMSIILSAYVVQTIQRLRTEESSGRLEPLLSTGISRQSWVMSHVACALLGTGILVLLLGLTSGISYVLYADASWSYVPRLIGASFAQAPAILALCGFAVASFALMPRATAALSWAGFGLCLFIGQFGDLLKLPQFTKDISPFTHTPTAPAEAVSALPLALLMAIAIGFTILGLAWFRRRDIANG
jgi:ABC-2 type transport system permease protein